MRHLMGEVEKDVNRIKYSKKHNQVLKKLHTTDGLRLANPDAFAEMQKIDPHGKLWKGSDYEDIFGYKRPVGRSEEAFQVMTKIEKESSPDQIQIRREKQKIANRIRAVRCSFQR